MFINIISIQDQNTEKLELAKGQMIYFLHSLGSLGFLGAGDFVSIRTKNRVLVPQDGTLMVVRQCSKH